MNRETLRKRLDFILDEIATYDGVNGPEGMIPLRKALRELQLAISEIPGACELKRLKTLAKRANRPRGCPECGENSETDHKEGCSQYAGN